VGNWRQSFEAKKAKKSSDDAATDGDFGAFVFRRDVAWTDNSTTDSEKLL